MNRVIFSLLPGPFGRAVLAGLALLSGCAGNGFPEVDNARWLTSIGSPSVKRIRDLGTRLPPEAGPLRGESDGVASPGEYLLIEGGGFGKQPTVTIAGKAAEVTAHTVGGGLVVKVPVGVATGPQVVEVAVGQARSSKSFPLRRLAAVLHAGVVRFVELTDGGVKPFEGSVPAPGAKALRISSDGACAYVATANKLWIFDLGAPGGPKFLTSRDVALERVTGMAGAERAPILFVVGANGLQGFGTDDPRSPARYPVAPLPGEVRGVDRPDVDAEGKRMAVLVPELNRLFVVDVSKRETTSLVGEIAVLPEAVLPLVRDVRFSSDGETIWIVSGDGAGSVASGTQPTRLSGVRVQREDATEDGQSAPAAEGGHAPGSPGNEAKVRVDFWRTAMVPFAGAPMRLVMTRGKTIASGATIRMPPEKTTVRFTSVDRRAIGLGAGKTSDAAALAGEALSGPLGGIDQTDATGEGSRVIDVPMVLGSAEFLPDNDVLIAAAARDAGGVREYGLARISVVPPIRAGFTALGPAGGADLKLPFAVGEVRVQP